MGVEVKFFANLRKVVGKKTTRESGDTVRDLIKNLIKEHGELEEELFESETGELKNFINILINGERIEVLDGMETKLNDGDRVAIFPPAAGG